jgi:hypothetical protein
MLPKDKKEWKNIKHKMKEPTFNLLKNTIGLV